MLTVGFCNLKGGVGKTTACLNLAVALARMKKKVAVIDMDPQSNLTFGFGVHAEEGKADLFEFLNGTASWDDVVVSREGVDIVPSTLDLVMLELAPQGKIENDTLLKEALQKTNPKRYDYIFCDSPPQLGIFTRNVFAAADELFVPLEGGFFSLAGLRTLTAVTESYRERLNPKLKIGGIMLTCHNHTVLMHREVRDEARKFFKETFFDSFIRRSVSLVEASSAGVSIFEYAPRSNAALDYRAAANEFVKKRRDAKNGKTKP